MIKVSKAVAMPELFEFLERAGVDVDVDDMLEDDRNDFEAMVSALVKPITQGRAMIDGEAYVLTLHKPMGEMTSISVREPSGLAWELMDRAKKGEDMKRVMRFIEGFTSIPYAQIVKLSNRDMKVLTKFAQLFMG